MNSTLSDFRNPGETTAKSQLPPAKRRQILIVDDSPVNSKLMQHLLSSEGHGVRTAGQAEEALRVLDDFRPDLILTNVRLPGMGGLELIRRIKANPETSDIAIVSLTAVANTGDREEALAAGCYGHITKPVETATLGSRVNEILERQNGANSPSPQAFLSLTVGGPEMEGLRRRFLSESTERSLQLLDTLGMRFNPAEASKQVQEWAGNAEILGYPEILQLADRIHELLAVHPFRIPDLREALSVLSLTFSQLRDAIIPPVPEHIAETLSGRRIALVGFTEEHADGICVTLEMVGARPSSFPITEDPASESIRRCDLVMVHVRPETSDSVWLSPSADAATCQNIVLTGERRDLLNLPVAVQSRISEYVVDAWQPEEVLLRLNLALSRSGGDTPIAKGAAPAPAPSRLHLISAPSYSEVSRSKIVVADDDPIILTLVVSMLQNYGMTCKTANNGQDALRMIRAERPGVAVLDVNMPGLDGFEVLAGVRAENMPVHVVLLTACQKENDIVRAFDLGADDYLVKPFNPFELVARVKRLVRK